MSLVSVPALYDGKQIRLLENAPVVGPYRVLVTFLEPASAELRQPADMPRFWASFGAWQDSRSLADTLQDIHATRLSKTVPPKL